MATTSAIATDRPSATAVLQQLAKDSDAERLSRLGPLVALPPAGMLAKLLVGMALALLLAVTWFLAVLAADILRVMDGVRSQRTGERMDARQLPAGEDLVEATALGEAIRLHPVQAGQLHSRRAMALARAGRDQDALAAFDEARLTTIAALPPGVEVAWAECLARLGRWRETRDRLLACRLAGWPEAERQRAVRLLAEAWDRLPGAPAGEDPFQRY